MFPNAFANVGNYLWSYLPGANQEAPRSQVLMQKLVDCVADDNDEELASLLADEQDVALVTAELKQSAYSPWHRAAAQGRAAVMQVMLDKLPLEAWDFRTQESECTAFMLAAEHNHAEILFDFHRTLGKRYGELPAFSPSAADRAATMIKTRLGYRVNAEADAFRLQWGRIVNAKDRDGNTPLILAVKNDHLICGRVLRILGADVLIQNNQAESARSLAMGLPVTSPLRQVMLWNTDPATRAVIGAQARPATLPRIPEPGATELHDQDKG